MSFINRVEELAALEAKVTSGGPELVVVYGRRRIGKTSLLLHWLQSNEDLPQCYWVAHKTSSTQLLESFSAAVGPLFGHSAGKISFSNWETALRETIKKANDTPLLVVLDEFPYLIQSCPEIPSLLQKLWDHHGKKSGIVLVLCGSHYHMMVDQLFSSRQPLYGRATGSLLLEEVKPRELGQFLPRYSADQLAKTAAVIGGVPHYLELWDDGKPPMRNLEDLILSDSTLFRHEALFLIQEELPEPRTYLAILESLGAGFMTPGAIAKKAGIDRGHIGKYLHTLVNLRFVRRLISSDIEQRSHTRTSRYEIRDPYLRFYFEFIYRHPEWIEQRRIKKLRAHIEAKFDAYVGKQVFEEWARQHLLEMGDSEQLSFVPDEVGRAWNPRVEIDVLAVSWKEKSAIAGECKWRGEKMGKEELSALRERSKKLDRVEGFAFQFALFSKSGFTKDLLEVSKTENLLLFQGHKFERV